MVLCFSDDVVMIEERAKSQTHVLTEMGYGNICFHPHNDLFSVKTTRTHNFRLV